MASRKDLLKAQTFTTQRLVSAFVDRDPDKTTNPLKRVGVATFVSIMLAIVLVAGTALIGFLKPGNSSAWRSTKGVIQDINSGALFIYVPGPNGADGLLLPMADIASARLAAGTTTVTTVKTAKLQGVPQDVLRGIVNAPRQLPAPAEIKPYPLRLCATPTDSAGQRYLTMEVGQGRSHQVSDDVSVVVKAQDGESYLLVDGVYHKLWRKGSASVVELGLPVVTSAQARRSVDYWLAAQPLGEPIEPLKLPDVGGVPSSRQAQPDLLIGSVAMVAASELGPAQYFIQTPDGLARTTYLNMITELAANERQNRPVVLDAAIAAANMSTRTPELRTPGLRFDPPTPPVDATLGPDDALCATYVDPAKNGGRTTPVITLGDPTPDLPAVVTKRPPADGFIDYMKLAPLQGALLENMASTPGMEGDSASWLVLGDRRYGIPTLADRQALGYPPPDEKGGATVVAVPGMFIRLIPDGLPQGRKLTQSDINPPLPPLPK